jgi:hypothetical protein
MSLEDIDHLFGDRLVANLPHKSGIEDRDPAVAENPKLSMAAEKLG